MDRQKEASPKKVIDADVVLLMDSNKRHIDAESFWDKTWKIRVATAEELESVIHRFDFSKVKHIIISTGTNDTDSRNADSIFSDLVKGADILTRKYSSKVYVSQLPPRKMEKKETVKKVNFLIANGIKEGVNVIMQDNLSEKHLHDEKHIRKNCLWILVENMTNKIREVMGLPPVNRTNAPPSPREKSPGRQTPGKRTSMPPTAVTQIIGIMEQSQKMMLQNMREMMMQCLGT